MSGRFVAEYRLVNAYPLVKRFSVFLYIIRRFQPEKLLKMFAEIFDVIDPYQERRFADRDVRRDQQLRRFPQPDKADKAARGLSRNRFDAVV